MHLCRIAGVGIVWKYFEIIPIPGSHFTAAGPGWPGPCHEAMLTRGPHRLGEGHTGFVKNLSIEAIISRMVCTYKRVCLKPALVLSLISYILQNLDFMSRIC